MNNPKTVIMLTAGIIIMCLMTISTVVSNIPLNAQQPNNNNGSEQQNALNKLLAQYGESPDQQNTKWAKILSENPDYTDYGTCDNSGKCEPMVDVVFESNKTIVLNSENDFLLWKIVDQIKSDGFSIDDFSTYADNSGYRDFMVILSK